MTKKTAVILANLGSPTAPTTKAVRKFLADFLGDPRVVNIPRPIWWIILNCFVLPFRPSKSAKAYKKIWHEKGSPLAYLTREITEKLAVQLAEKGVITDYAMRYGEPSIATRLKEFKEQGVTDVVVLPLYPQYSSTTTASIYDDLIKELNHWWHIPSFQFISDYHDNEHYIAALAESIQVAWQAQPKNELLVMSFHGLPKRNLLKGDPYHCECLKTGRLLGEALGLIAGQYLVTFQSRFGKAEWLKPYTAPSIEKLAEEGCQRIDIFCPGFPADCLETLEEIAMEARDIFLEHGGQDYRYIPCLNGNPKWINALSDIAHEHLQGWPLGVESDAVLALRSERAEAQALT